MVSVLLIRSRIMCRRYSVDSLHEVLLLFMAIIMFKEDTSRLFVVNEEVILRPSVGFHDRNTKPNLEGRPVITVT